MTMFHEVSGVGQGALWIGFVGMLLPTLFYFSEAFAGGDEKKASRLYHGITVAVTGIASIAYLSMALGFGVMENEDGRPFFYARYMDWSVTTPLLIMDLGLLAGFATSDIFVVCVFDVMMIAAGFLGGFIHFTHGDETAKWAYFILGMLFFIPVVKALLSGMMVKAASMPTERKNTFSTLAWLTAVMWAFYPLAWIACEGLDAVSSDTELILYTILDVISKSVFGVILLNAKSSIAE